MENYIIIFKKDSSCFSKGDFVWDEDTKSYKLWNGEKWLGEKSEEFLKEWEKFVEREKKPTFFEEKVLIG